MQTQPPDAGCTVIVTVDAPPEVMPDLVAHASAGLDLFVAFDGYLAGTLHRSVDGTRLVQIVNWIDQDRYQACIDDARWDDLDSARTFMAHVQEGRATMTVHVVDVLKTTSTAA